MHGGIQTVHAGAHVCCPSEYSDCKNICVMVLLPCRVIWAAVFDGHAGKQVAALASKQLHDNVVSSGFVDASNFPVSHAV